MNVAAAEQQRPGPVTGTGIAFGKTRTSKGLPQLSTGDTGFALAPVDAEVAQAGLRRPTGGTLMSELLEYVRARLRRPERVIEVSEEMVSKATNADQRRARRLCELYNITLREVIPPVAGREH